MIVKLLTEHHFEFLSLKGGCRGSSESTHVKIPHCWKSNALAHISSLICFLVEQIVLKLNKTLLLYVKFLLISNYVAIGLINACYGVRQATLKPV